MCLTLETDYAVRIVGCLTTEGRRADAKYIAEQTGVTLRFALKILQKLVATEIVRSFKGIQGGYELARHPSEITLYDVVSAIEGDYYLNKCHDENFVCTNTQKGCCAFRQVFTKVSEQVRLELSSHNFEELVRARETDKVT